jgi:dienelactone hydrolase
MLVFHDALAAVAERVSVSRTVEMLTHSATRLCAAALGLVGACPPGDAAEAVDPTAIFQTPGAVNGLPVMRDALVARMTFPLAWSAEQFPDFAAWRAAARAKYCEALLAAPPTVDFAPVVRAETDRGTHSAREVVFNLTSDSRVLALMTIPKGDGPFPAVLLLHDHGGRFDLGKEKMIKPLDGDAAKLATAREWVEKGYGGRFVGDELARRGYVCLATDVLNWSDRAGGGYDAQQAIASNLFNLGSSFAGLIAWEDRRAAEFLATFPGVDSRRVAAIGWSMGGYRAWQVAALSDHVAASVSICWIGTLEGLVAAGGNLTRGGSSYTTSHPGLANHLDYPDRAAIACPKPMLFFAGRQDKLFPVDSVETAFSRMRAVWSSQGAGDRLVTKLWDLPHLFNREMQDEAFAWLDRTIK